MFFRPGARHIIFYILILAVFAGNVPALPIPLSSSNPGNFSRRDSHNRLLGPAHPRPPRTYDVQHYTLRSRFDVANKTLIGDETVALKPLAAGFKSFELDAAAMQIESVTLDGSNKTLQWTQPPERLSIALDRAYEPAETISVQIKYRATSQQRGLFFIQHGSVGKGGTQDVQIWTQGEPEDNHLWFPCYDFPDDKATSEQYITTGSNQIAISNGQLLETTNNDDGTRTFHWKMDAPHSSYLMSFVVGDYVKLTDTYKNVSVEYYTYHGTEAQARRSFSKTPQLMELYSRLLNYEYPYTRYSQTIVSQFVFGGMENITSTTQADTEILRNVSDESPFSPNILVAHELAHSWFGDLVTCKNWANLWLNEGFATFMEAVFIEEQRGHLAYLTEMRGNQYSYFNEDEVKYRRPLVYDRYQSPNDLLDTTTYKKGAFVIHMLREQVGDEAFWKALNRYLNKYKYQNVDSSDLQKVFEEVSGQKLDWFFEQWVYKAG
ncbi:MAG TPA: M1 family metallopeptidase, partial [Pyrinomonadaceae bacterium]|nr:M1 family metallopeptidase [Pyrinomonadaceae bacterium]